MKKLFCFIILLVLGVSAANAQRTKQKPQLPNFYKVRADILKQLKDASLEESIDEPDGMYTKFKRWEYFMKPRTFPSGNYFSPDALMKEFNSYFKTHPQSTRQQQGGGWTALGPFGMPAPIDANISSGVGRINCIALHPVDTNIFYIGTACGGIWKTVNHGVSWVCQSDQLPSMSITDISINPAYPDSVYAATGDAPGNFAAQPTWNPNFPGGHYAAGVIMTGDGGMNWTQTNLNYTQAQTAVMYRVIVHPVKTNIVLAATANGLFRSTDGGANWTSIYAGPIYDLAVNPLDASKWYAIAARKLIRSYDDGATWTPGTYTFLVPQAVIRMAVTPADTSRLYFARSNALIMRSLNGGQTILQVANVSSNGHQSDYDKPIAVSPTDANTLYVGLVPLMKSTNGGTAWTNVSSFVNTDPNYIHPDFHGLQVAPYNSNKVFAVNDGGIWVSYNAGATWQTLNNGINISQYYKLGSSYTNPDLVFCGAQDNSVHRYDGTGWKQVTCCDGMECAVDFADEHIVYASTQGGNFMRSADGGLTFPTNITPGGGNWVTPFAMNPGNSNNIYIGLTDVWSSESRGSSWASISPVFDATNYLTVVRTAPSDSNIIYAASFNTLHNTLDHGGAWNDIVAGLPVDSAAIYDVAVSENPLVAWVVFSGYVDGKKVYKTTDGGSSWVNISGTLPNVPVNCIEYQHGTGGDLYIGTDFGVFYRNDAMSDWVSFNSSLPYVMVMELELNYQSGKLLAATYGRGLYETYPVTPVTFNTTDAGVVSIIKPVTDLYCDSLSSPLIVGIRNFGSANLTSVDVNYSLDGSPVTTIPWTGNLAHLASENDTLTQLNITSGGSHSVLVYTSNPNGSADQLPGNDSRTTSFSIDNTVVPYPVTEGFESPAFPPANWNFTGISNSMWVHSDTIGAYGLSSKSAYANFYDIQSGTENIESSRIDLTTAVAPVYLGFSHAYARYNTSYVDTLEISITDDCGTSWYSLYQKWDTALCTDLNFYTAKFFPTASQWTTDYIDISSYIGQNVKVRFEAESGYGNSLFLDDINIYHGPTEVEEHNQNMLSLYPNPTDGKVFIKDPAHIIKGFSIYDMHGRCLAEEKNRSSVIDMSKYDDGMYFVRLQTEKTTVLKKVCLAR